MRLEEHYVFRHDDVLTYLNPNSISTVQILLICFKGNSFSILYGPKSNLRNHPPHHSKKTNETYVWRSLFLHACFVIKTKNSAFAKTIIFLGHWFIPGEASSVRQKDTTETLKDAGYYLSLPFWSSVECTDSHFFTAKSP